MIAPARDAVLKHFAWVNGHADIWPVFRDPEALRAVVAGLVEPVRGAGITVVCGLEARGFLLGGAAAVALGAGFVPARKSSALFPGPKVWRKTAPDYREIRHMLFLQRTAIGPGDRVLLVDDWAQTGSQALAVKEMIIECGAEWAGCSIIVDELLPEVRPRLDPVYSLLIWDELPSAVASAF